jgi:hypothetical protein
MFLSTNHKNSIDLAYGDKEQLHERECVISFMRRRQAVCERKEKQAKEIGENLSLEKRKKEKMPARRKNLTEMKDNSQDRLR